MSERLVDVIARQVRAIRKSTGLSQDQYARRIGMHWSQLSQIECAARNLTLQSVERLAESMGVSVDDLFDRGPQSHP